MEILEKPILPYGILKNLIKEGIDVTDTEALLGVLLQGSEDIKKVIAVNTATDVETVRNMDLSEIVAFATAYVQQITEQATEIMQADKNKNLQIDIYNDNFDEIIATYQADYIKISYGFIEDVLKVYTIFTQAGKEGIKNADLSVLEDLLDSIDLALISAFDVSVSDLDRVNFLGILKVLKDGMQETLSLLGKIPNTAKKKQVVTKII
jgi:hypothetical protein